MVPGPGAQCGETAGFLFSHPCKNPPIHACAVCRKPVCASHARHVQGRFTCISCSREHVAPGTYNDPYDYSTRWYPDYTQYDRWDRYRRRPDPAPSGDPVTPGTGFGEGADWGESGDAAQDFGAGASGDVGGDEVSAGAAADLGGDDLGEGAAAEIGGDDLDGGASDGWESDFDAS
jgi:hypothetical protein